MCIRDSSWTIDESITTLADNGDQTFTFTNESGAATTIDVAALETLTNLTSVVTGQVIGSYTNEAGATVNLEESITTLAQNPDDSFTFTSEDGTATTIDVSALETLTNLTSVVTGQVIGSYTNEAGATVNLQESITDFTQNPDGSYTFTSEDGTATTIDVSALETLTNLTSVVTCLLYTSPSPRDATLSRMPSSA